MISILLPSHSIPDPFMRSASNLICSIILLAPYPLLCRGIRLLFCFRARNIYVNERLNVEILEQCCLIVTFASVKFEDGIIKNDFHTFIWLVFIRFIRKRNIWNMWAALIWFYLTLRQAYKQKALMSHWHKRQYRAALQKLQYWIEET